MADTRFRIRATAFLFLVAGLIVLMFLVAAWFLEVFGPEADRTRLRHDSAIASVRNSVASPLRINTNAGRSVDFASCCRTSATLCTVTPFTS